MDYVKPILTLYFETKKLNNNHLVHDAVLLYFMSARNVVEMLTEFSVVPVIVGLARSWTDLKACWHTLGSCCDVVQGLVGWWHPTHQFTVVWFHPAKIHHLPWPRGDDRQQEEAEKAECSLEIHVCLSVVLNQTACCIQQHKYRLTHY